MKRRKPSRKSRAFRIARVYARRLFRHIRMATPATALVILMGLAWCIGGASRSNSGQIAFLEVTAIALAGLVSLALGRRARVSPIRLPRLFLAALLVIVVLQLLPLPWELWRSLPGHAEMATGLERLGLGGRLHPLSLAPEKTLSALLHLIPPVVVFWIATQLSWRLLMAVLVWLALALGALSTLWGAGQVLGLAPHLYAWTNFGIASGPFANPNHQATLLLMTLPLISAMAGQARQVVSEGRANGELALLWSSAAVFTLVGVFAAGSLFGFMFAPFVIAACLLIGAGDVKVRSWRMITAGIVASVVVFVLIASTLGLDQLGGSGDASDLQSRSEIAANTLEAISRFSPTGSGLGTFENVYPQFESGEIIPATYVNHAHNEYLQLTLELGFPGVALMAILVLWLLFKASQVWLAGSDYGSLLRAKMATSISILVPVFHSLLDYPLRTQAVACLAAACLALLFAEREKFRPASEEEVASVDPVQVQSNREVKVETTDEAQ